MTTDFQDFRALAKTRYPSAFVPRNNYSFAIVINGLAILFASVPGEPALAIIRAQVLHLDQVRRGGDFAVAAAAANFFWSGTRGATLSLGDDGVLYLTERRPLDELNDAESLDACIDDFQEAVTDWQARSELYA